MLLGALGAHGLEDHLDPLLVDYWSTAVLFQLVHALVLVAVGILGRLGINRWWIGISAGGFVLGVVMFCGALYGLALGLPGTLAMFAPLGGMALVVGWATFLVGALRWR